MLIRECQCPPRVLIALAATRPREFPVLLDSAAASPLSRWSILAAFPSDALLQHGDGTGLLDALRQRLQAEPAAARAATPLLPLPFTGGWVVYLGYELAAECEPTLRLPALPDKALQACALRIPAALLWDHQQQRGYALAEAGQPSLLESLLAAVAGCDIEAPALLPALTLREDEPGEFCAGVQRTLEHIRAGDVYQLNLSRGWQCEWPQAASSAALYHALRAANPAPFAAWAQLPGLEILSSSPERLVRISGRRVETRPIAGTRPRTGGVAGIAGGREIAAMLASDKERAEHTMLIDLERNDLGRVCVGGSVEVSEFMVPESYAHVHHIVSNVQGTLQAAAGPVEVLRAVFPGGTITGCPKIRCMQLIAGIEGQPRGAYTGSLGYINHDGSMDFNILIRSFTVANGVLQCRAGAGIVADSSPLQELAETRAKARGLLQALAGASP